MPDVSAKIAAPFPQILETEVEGEISLYDPHTESVLVLNHTASDVWRLCDGEQTMEEIVELLTAAYQVRQEDIRDDVERTVQQFISGGFLPDHTA